MRRLIRITALHVTAIESERFAEAEPQLGMILAAALFVDEILEQQLPRRKIVALRVHRADEGRKRQRVVIVLTRIFAQLFGRQRAGAPALIERMIEQTFVGDLLIERWDELHRYLHFFARECTTRTRGSSHAPTGRNPILATR